MIEQDEYLSPKEAALHYGENARYKVWAYSGYVNKIGSIDGRVILGMENGHIKFVELIDPLQSKLKNPKKIQDILEKENKYLKQLCYDAIDFLRVLEEDGEFKHWGEGYNKQVLEELRQDAKKLLN